MKICIDNNGNVIDANFSQKGSTIADRRSIQAAIANANAKKWKFNADPMAPEKQCGTVSYSFKVK